MAIINPEGLFGGDRLAKCSDKARLYWPFFFLASNGFGRLEISYRKLLTKAFSSFQSPPSEQEVLELLREYQKNYLLFLYACDGILWGQWDTDSKNLPRHHTAQDKQSPAPPSAEYETWKSAYLESKKSQVVDLQAFQNISEIPHTFSKTFRENVRGVGVGVGEGEGINHGVAGATQVAEVQFKIEPVPNKPPRGTRVPEDFAVTDEYRAFAKKHALPAPDGEVERFKDYWRGIAGSRGRKLDWPATFRNWLRTAKDISNGKAPPKPAPSSAFKSTSEKMLEKYGDRDGPRSAIHPVAGG